MKNFYKYSLLLLTIMILTVSAASAADADDMANMTSVDDSTDKLANDENSFSALQNDVEGEGTSESSTDNDNELLTSENNDKLSATPGTFSDLNEKIENAENGVLDLEYNFTYNPEEDGDNFKYGISITKDITINGNGFTISGNNTVREFHIETYGTVTLNNITFANGKSNEGGAIYIGSGNVNINNCAFKNNNATYGGAIYMYWEYGTANIINCTFENNIAEGDDGSGGAIFNGYYNMNIDGCIFNNNKAKAGGAIYNEGDGEQHYIINSIFKNNNAAKAKSIYMSYDEVYFENNTVNTKEAEIVIESGAVTSNVTATVLENRQGIFVKAGSSVKLNATVEDDKGNLIYADYLKFTVTGEENPLETTPSTTNYTADYTMPTTLGLYTVSMIDSSEWAFSNLTVKTATLTNLMPGTYTDLQARIDATPEGGVLDLPYNFTYNPEIDGENFILNDISITKDITINGNGFTISGNNSKGIFNIDSFSKEVTLNNITFANGNGGIGGAINFKNDDKNAILNIKDCTFENNTASLSGGAIYSQSEKATLKIDGCTFKNNTANYGGAIYCHSNSEGYLNISNSIFKDNEANINGKSIYTSFTRLKLEKNTINTTYAEIYLENSEVIKPIVTVLGNKTVYIPAGQKITLNLTVADDNGNLIYYSKKSEFNETSFDFDYFNVFNFTIGEETFGAEVGYEVYTAEYTMPTETGTYTVGAKYINDEISIILKTGQLTNEAPIVPGTYTDLQARIDATPEGGVLDLPYNFTYNPEIDGENFPDGVKITKEITINGNGFTINGNNTVREFHIETENTVALNNITFANGKAEKGGAIYGGYSYGGIDINDCTFENNNATNGGAIFNGWMSLTVDNNIFKNNDAETGGAIYHDGGEGADVKISNSKFEENTAKNATSIFMNGDSLLLENNTINTESAGIVIGEYVTVITPVTITVLDGKNIPVKGGEEVTLYATIVDDKGNLIYAVLPKFTVPGESDPIATTPGYTNYTATYTVPATPGIYNVSMSYNRENGKQFDKATIINGTLDYRMITEINVTADEDSTYPNATVTITTNVDGNYTVKIGNTTKTVELKANTPTKVNLTGLSAGDNQVVNVTFKGNEACSAAVNDTVKINIKKATPLISVNATDATYPGDVIVNITTDAPGTYIIKIGNATKEVNLTAGDNRVNVPGVSAGDNQVVNVTFKGNENYTSSFNDKAIVNIKKTTPKLNVTANKENYPNDVRINVTSDVDGKVEVKVGNVTKIVDVKAGVTQEVIIDNATVGENQVVNVTYIENENCTSAVNDTNTVNVNKYTPKINVTMNSDEYPASINVTADVTGEYTIKVGNISKKVKLEKGKPQRITLEGLTPSDSPYQVNVTSDANPDYNAAFNDTVEIKVAKGTPKLEVATEDVNHYPNVVVNITSDANGTVNVTIHLDDGKSMTKQVNVTAGETVSVPFEGISPSKSADGHYVEATYLENDMYNNVTEGASLHVYPANATLNVTADAVQGENSTITIKVPENATGNVTVTIDGKNYTGTIKNGTATITGPVLPSGDTPANVTYTSDNGNYMSKTVPATIHVKTVEADVKDMKRGWNSPYDYQTTLTDEDGKGIAGKNIVFTINGKQYNATTDSNGVAKLTGSKLDVGEYNVTVTNTLTGENKTAKITIVARLLENNDLTKDYLSSKQFTVLAIGDDGNPVGAGEVVTLVTHGVTYKQKTDKTGHATLLIRLVPGNYPITATYKGFTVKNNIKVKQTLKLVKKTVSVKKGKKIILKATLKWTSGKAIKGKIIKFKFKGKTYKAKTNSKGLAKVTIKSKKVLKKLKKGKKYSYSATYVKNKVKGKVKIK